MKEDKFPHPGHPLHQPGDELKQTEAQRKEEQLLSSREDRENSTDTPSQCPALPSPRGVCWYTWGLGAESWVSANRPRERTGVVCTETAQSTTVQSSRNSQRDVQNRGRVNCGIPTVMCKEKEGQGYCLNSGSHKHHWITHKQRQY